MTRTTSLYEMHLPVCKVGDDINFHLAGGDTPAAALAAYADELEAAARVVREVAAVLTSQDVQMDGDGPFVGLCGPAALLRPLVAKGVLSELEVGDDESGEQWKAAPAGGRTADDHPVP